MLPKQERLNTKLNHSFVSKLSQEQQQMFWHLTPFAFDLILPKFDSMNKVQIVSVDELKKTVQIKSKEGIIEVSENKCVCSFVTSLCLPSHHILKVRQINNTSELSAERWSRKYYSAVCRVIPSNYELKVEISVSKDPVNVTTVEPIKPKRILNQHEKYRKAHIKAKRLASLTSEATGQEYLRQLSVLKYIAEKWENEKPFQLKDIDNLLKQNEENDENEEILHMDENIDNLPKQNEENNKIPNDISTLELPTLPPRVPKRGRPKDYCKDKTAIGIAKRKKVSGLVLFEKLDTQSRHLEMLNWFVDKNVGSIAVSGNALISEGSIENNPNNKHCAVLDCYLVIDDIRRYFYNDGWAALQQVVEIKR